MKKFLTLGFLPVSADLALLVLRVGLGLSLLLNHGWSKLTGFSQMAGRFSDPLGVGSSVSLALAVVGEVVCATLIVLGLCTRLAALGSAATMGVAFFMMHNANLKEGELAFVFLTGFVALLFAGGGRFSADQKFGV